MPFTNNQIKTLNKLLPPESAEHLIECCANLENVGFTPEQLLWVAKKGGNPAVEVLKDLILMHINNGQTLIDEKTGEPWTRLSALLYAGFSTDQLITVLSNNGGSKNMHALEKLLQLVYLDDGQQTTQLQLLLAAGISAQQLIVVLSKHGGSKSLKALQDLLQPVHLDDGQQLTQLQLLATAGFSAEQLIAVLSHNGGSNNLYALLNLLYPEDLNDISPLQLLVGFGFSTEQLISVLNQDGGSNNLRALQDLLLPMQLEDGQQTTQLQLLVAAGFNTEQLIAVLSNDGGAKNLTALISLMRSNEIQAMITSYKKGNEIIANLAQGYSKSAHLDFLFNILSTQVYREYIVEQGVLEYLCKEIKPWKAKMLTQLQINSIDELKLLCPQPKSQRVKPRAGKKSAATEQTIPSVEPQNLAIIDNTLPQLDSDTRKRTRKSASSLDSQGLFKKAKFAETARHDMHGVMENELTTNSP